MLKETDRPADIRVKGLLDSHAGLEGTEVVELCPENQVRQLRVGKEHDEEHDGESQQVFSAPGHGAGQLAHGLIKIDELE